MPHDRETIDLINAILDRIKRTGETAPTDAQIADAAGVARNKCSKWRVGAAAMSLDELANLVDRYGADVVLSPLADRTDAEVVPRTVRAAACAKQKVVELGAHSARLTLAVHSAAPDGIDDVELADIEMQIERGIREHQELLATVRKMAAAGRATG